MRPRIQHAVSLVVETDAQREEGGNLFAWSGPFVVALVRDALAQAGIDAFVTYDGSIAGASTRPGVSPVEAEVDDRRPLWLLPRHDALVYGGTIYVPAEASGAFVDRERYVRLRDAARDYTGSDTVR